MSYFQSKRVKPVYMEFFSLFPVKVNQPQDPFILVFAKPEYVMLSIPSPFSALPFSNLHKSYYYGVANAILVPSEMNSVLRTLSTLLLLFCVPLISARLAFYPLFSEPNATITRVSQPFQPSTILQLLALLLTIPTVRNHRKHPCQFTRPPNTRQRFPRFLARTGNKGSRLRPPERDLELEPDPYTGRVVFAPYVLL